MNTLYRLLTSMALLLLAACGSSPSPSGFIRQDPLKPIEENLKDARLWCDDSSKCPENVGYIVMITKDEDGDMGVSQCTGFLVSPTIVATNSHCIPDSVKNEGADCGSNLGIKFPAIDGKSEEVHLCGGLLHASKIVENEDDERFLKKPDYAFFSLKTPSNRRAFEFSRSGIDDGVSAIVYSVDPMSEYSLQGRLVKRSCVSHKGGEFIPADLHAFSDVVAMFGPECEVHGGNSGSPVIGPDEKVVGFIHGGLKDGVSLDEIVNSEFRESSLEKPAIVTNVACLPPASFLPSLGEPAPSCASSAIDQLNEAKKAEKELRLQTGAIKQLQDAYAKWLASTTQVFLFKSEMKLQAVDNLRYAVLTPKILCLRPRELWGATNLTSLLYTESTGSIVGGGNNDEMVHNHFEVPSFKIEIIYDPQFRQKPRVSELSSLKYEVSFKPNLVKETEAEVGTDRLVLGPFNKVEIPLYLRHCTKAELEAPPDLSIVEE